MTGLPATLGIAAGGALAACAAGLALGPWGWGPAVAAGVLGGFVIQRRFENEKAGERGQLEAGVESLLGDGNREIDRTKRVP